MKRCSPVVVAVLGAVLSGAPVSAQKPGGIPRLPDGHPNLQGVWNFSTPTPLERPVALGDKVFYSDEELRALERESAPLTEGTGGDRDRRNANPEIDVGLAYNEAWSERGMPIRRTSLIVDPPTGRLPALTPDGRKRSTGAQGQGERGADSWEDRSLWERCITRSGLPRLPGTYNNNVQILQTRDHVVLLYEMIHEARIVPLDGRPHNGPGLRQLLGDSRGRWDGDTLVIETTNFSTRASFRGSNVNMTLTERLRRTGADTIEYTFTVDDPTTFTKAWTAELPFRRIPTSMFEYACHEGNYGLVNVLSGARAQERAAAGSGARN